MKGLSDDLEVAIANAIETLAFNVDIKAVNSEKLDALMRSKADAFIYTKELILTWQTSQNSPKETKLRKYITSLIKAGENSVKDLRLALRKNIDTELVDPEHLGRAIKAKPIIFKAINELNSGIIQLKLQLQSNNIDLKTREFKVGYPERFANQEFYPEKDYYKEWYSEEHDAIIIDPKGTIGEILILDNLKIALPIPPPKSEILYSNLPKEEQYWRRPEPPAGLNKETQDLHIDYILEEFRRRREGLWFMNNGKPVWVCPAHYMGLTHNKMLDNGGYKDFRWAQCQMYYFTLACIIDKRCVGELFVKGRRTGFTEEIIDYFITYSTSVKNALFGITSKTGDDAEAVFLKYSYAIQNLPFFFQPIVKNKIDDKNKMEFGKVSDNTKEAKKKQDTQTDDYLNTRVDYQASTTLAYDSKKLFFYLADECFAKGTKILMADYTFKNIEDIIVGDKVIVEGGKEIEVQNTFSGKDKMYIVKQPYGKDYVVNSKHKLYLEQRNNREKNGFKELTPIEFLQKTSYEKRTLVRVLSKGFDFKEQDLPLDPYFFGLWLGDGSSYAPSLIVNPIDDPEIKEYHYSFAEKIGMSITEHKKGSDKTYSYYYKNKEKTVGNQTTGLVNKLMKIFQDMNVIKNKHIPEIYMKSSREQRLKLLAGILDSDGYNSGKSYSLSMSRENLIKQIYTLAKQLGLDTSEIKEKKTNFNTICYNLSIQKHTDIPCIIERKKTTTGNTYKSRRLKTSVEYKGFENYYGIQLKTDNNDDRRLILEDYTLTMNCGKREKPQNIIDHWNNVKPTMVQGGVVVGKCFMGSTLNPKDKGGKEYEELYIGSDVTQRNANGRTSTGLYSFFLPAHKNMEDYTDKYGICHEVVENGDFFYNSRGEKKTIGSLQFLENEFASAKKMGGKVYNNTRRLDPTTISDAFRDEATSQLLPVEKINEQLRYNREQRINEKLVRGNFYEKENEIVWRPEDNGRFLVYWIPPKDMRNKFITKPVFGVMTRCPVNDDIGAFGCDTYDATDVVDAKLIETDNGVEFNLGSKGAMHGLTGNGYSEAPNNTFFLEYVARPKEAEIFFNDVLFACRFYSMPILVENNKLALLRHIKSKGYRGFCLTRFDKDPSKLTANEKELGGVPNTSADIINQHWTGLESYINSYVGEYFPDDGETPIREIGALGDMPFNRTLADWAKFDIAKRTKYDASISSGLAIMAVNRHKYKVKVERKPITLKFKRYR